MAAAAPAAAGYAHPVRRLWSPGWIAVHVLAVALTTTFLLLGWWQVRRAASGNVLSFAYAIEWPVFAGFVIFMWVSEMRRTLRRQRADTTANADDPQATPAPPARPNPRTGPAYDDSDDEELAAYNRYLAWLNANPHAKPADYPG